MKYQRKTLVGSSSFRRSILARAFLWSLRWRLSKISSTSSVRTRGGSGAGLPHPQKKMAEKIAIVGRNGSGKTTLIKILLRLYDPTSGIVEMDGKDYREYDVRSLRRRIGVVFQDFSCYASSVADNVLLRSVKSEKDEQTVVNSLKLCGLYEKVSALKNGIYTVLTKEFDEDGVIFSGGEMQKLAIARMFANDYDIIIMDEPSSALDPIAEYELNSKIIEAAANKTLIIVSHRLSTTKDADKIIYMENGRIEEMGTHKSLIELNGKYAELFNIQASKYYG